MQERNLFLFSRPGKKPKKASKIVLSCRPFLMGAAPFKHHFKAKGKGVGASL